MIFDLVRLGFVKMFQFFELAPWFSVQVLCSVTFKNYSSTTGMITLSCPRGLEGVTDS